MPPMPGWGALAYVEPSFAGTERHLAVHMPHLTGDLYGQCLRVEFVRHLRSEARLALAEQMEQDPVRVQVLNPV